MSDSIEYVPPKVWTWEKPSGGSFANINRPIAGPTHDGELPVGKHPLHLYSLATGERGGRPRPNHLPGRGRHPDDAIEPSLARTRLFARTAPRLSPKRSPKLSNPKTKLSAAARSAPR